MTHSGTLLPQNRPLSPCPCDKCYSVIRSCFLEFLGLQISNLQGCRLEIWGFLLANSNVLAHSGKLLFWQNDLNEPFWGSKIVIFQPLLKNFKRNKPETFATSIDWNMVLLPKVPISKSRRKYVKMQYFEKLQ